MRVQKLTKKELANLLNISVRILEKFEKTNILNDKLALCGYKYYGKDISKKPHVYKLILEDKDKREFYSMCNKELKTDGGNEFKTYFIKRSSEDILTRKDIASEAGVSTYMVEKWDKIMLEKDILSDKGYAYFEITYIDGNTYVRQCAQNDYNTFWRVKMQTKYYRDLRKKCEDGELTIEEMQIATSELSRLEGQYEGFFYYKVKLFNVNKENPIYIDIKQFIFSRNV